jgi:hypothetical protein
MVVTLFGKHGVPGKGARTSTLLSDLLKSCFYGKSAPFETCAATSMDADFYTTEAMGLRKRVARDVYQETRLTKKRGRLEVRCISVDAEPSKYALCQS